MRNHSFLTKFPPNRLASSLAIAAVLLLALALLAFQRGPLSVRQPVQGLQIEIVEDQPLVALPYVRSSGQAVNLPSQTTGGKLALPERFYSFGSIRANETVEHAFLLINEGDEPLVITQAYTTCACTTAVISTQVIPPGKAARATVIFDADYHNVRGATVRRGLVLQTSDPDQAQVEVWVQAEVEK